VTKKSERHITIHDTKGGPGQCRWCCGPVPKPRRSWCSDACVEAYKIRADGGYARSKVFERDNGICAVCRVDTEALQAEWLALLARIAIVERSGDRVRVSIPVPDREPVLCGDLEPHCGWRENVRVNLWLPTSRVLGSVNRGGSTLRAAVAAIVQRHAIRAEPDCPCEFHRACSPWGFRVGRTLWEADHILPVVEGGGGCGLDNLRTLCTRCHRQATAALAARRSALARLDRDARRRRDD